MQNTVLRTNFANGAVSPGVWDRTDWNKHSSSVRSAVNFFVSPTGGLRKRRGTRFLDKALEVIVDGAVRPPYLIKFEFSLGQTYILEFGQYTMRFWIDDYLIYNPTTNTPYQISTPYTLDQIIRVSTAQYKDTMFVTHWDLPIKKLVRGPSSTHTNWWWEDVIVDETVLVRAPEKLAFSVEGHNGVGYTVTAILNGQESKGAYEIATTRIHDEDVEKEFAKGVTLPANSTDNKQLLTNCVSWMTKYKSTLGSLPGFPTLDQRYADLLTVTNDIKWTKQVYGSDWWNGTVHAAIKAFYPYAAIAYGNKIDGSDKNYWYGVDLGNGYSAVYCGSWRSQNEYRGHWFGFGPGPYMTGGGTLDISGRGMLYGKTILIQGTGANTWWTGVSTYSDAVNTIGSVSIRDYLLGKYNSRKLYDQIIAFVNNQKPKKNNVITWANKTGYYTDNTGKLVPYPEATSFKIYRRVLNDSQHPHLYYVTTVPGTIFSWQDPDVSATVVDLQQSPPETGQYFDGQNKYPMACTLFQQRLVVGSTKESPLMIGASVPGFYNDFSISANPNDPYAAWVFELTSQTSNPIEHIIPIRTLYVLSQAGSFISTASGAVTAANVNFNQEAYAGASNIAPVIVDKSVIYVPLNRQMISSLKYEFTNDAFADDNMLFAAQHFLSGTYVRSLDYFRPISSLIMATTDDGRTLACTYIPRQEFMAWTEMITQGEFFQVCSYTNKEGFDEPYFTVYRNGQYVIEKMEDIRPFQDKTLLSELYLDSALTGIFSEDVNRVSGLDHLEGMVVGVVVDGSVQRDKVVVNGQITLDEPGKIIHVGLQFVASTETLDIEMQGVPTLRGTMRRIVKAVIGVEQTSDLTWQLNDGDKWDVPLTNAEDLASPPKIKTIDIDISSTCDYTNGTRIKLESRYPLPCTITSMVVEVQYA